MNPTQFIASKTFADAYIQGIRDLLRYGEHVEHVRDPYSIGSKFGRAERSTLEIVGYSFQVDNPFRSLFLSQSRVVRVPYCIGSFLWSIAGSDDLSWISYYNAAAHNFSDDGVHLFGAFGKRLFGDNMTNDQIKAIYTRLINDPSSRRTIGTISSATDNIYPSRDYPCCIAVQYLIRRDSLCAITFMRSQSALMVLPYDAFFFMALQCLLASQLGVKVGYYRHISSSFHIYEDEVELARQVAETAIVPIEIGPMSDGNAGLRELQQFEGELRKATIEKDKTTIEKLTAERFDPTSFFGQSKAALAAYSLALLGSSERIWRVTGSLNSPFKELLESYAREMVGQNV